MDILSKYNIDPYNVLGITPMADMETIKKAYKRKAIVLHPDKTNGRTEAEFKILVLSYKHAKQNCINSPVASQNQLRDRPKEEEQYTSQESEFDKNIYNTNFEDSRERSRLFSDDQIDFDTFEKQMKRIQNLPTSYAAETFYKRDVLEKMKTKGRFDLDKFNAFFLKLKKEGKTSTDLVKVEKVKAANEDDAYMKVNIYDGMVINVDDTKENYNYKENYVVTQQDMDDLLQTDVNMIDKLIREHKKDTDKIPTRKIKEMIRKKSQNVAVDRTKSFSQLERELDLKNMTDMQKEKKEQQEMVKKYKHIYTKSLPANYQFID